MIMQFHKARDETECGRIDMYLFNNPLFLKRSHYIKLMQGSDSNFVFTFHDHQEYPSFLPDRRRFNGPMSTVSQNKVNIIVQNQSLEDSVEPIDFEQADHSAFASPQPPPLFSTKEGRTKPLIQPEHFVEDNVSRKKKPRSQNQKFMFKHFKSKMMANQFIKRLIQQAYIWKPKNSEEFPYGLLSDCQTQSNREPTEINQNHHGQEELVQCSSQNLQKPRFNQLIANCEMMARKVANGVIEPDDPSLIFWGGLISILIMALLIILPFKIAFGINFTEHPTTLGICLFVEFMVLADSFVSFNKAYNFQGRIIKSKKLVMKRYLKNSLMKDVLKNICLYICMNSDNHPIVEISCLAVFIVLQLNMPFQFLQDLMGSFNLTETQSELLKLANIIFTVAYMAHVQACVWRAVAFYNPEDVTWITHKHLQESSIWTQYNYSFYWSTTTMITVGYGDITPKNDLELIVNNICMFFSCGVFAFCVNSIGMVLQNLERHDIEYRRVLQTMSSYMKKNNIKQSLQNRIKSYIGYLWEQERFFNHQEQQDVLDLLSKSLQKEIQFEIRKKYIEIMKPLLPFLSDEELKELCLNMEEVSYTPGEYIFEKDCQDDNSIYMVIKGSAQLIMERKGQFPLVIMEVKKGHAFGQLGFLTANVRSLTAISQEFSKFFKIKRHSLLAMAEKNPNLKKQILSHLAYRINFCQDYASIGLECYGCQSPTHLIENCRLVHLVLDKEATVKRERYPHNIPRIPFRRKHNNRQFQTLQQSKIVKDQAERLTKFLEDEDAELSSSSSHSSIEKESPSIIPQQIQSQTINESDAIKQGEPNQEWSGEMIPSSKSVQTPSMYMQVDEGGESLLPKDRGSIIYSNCHTKPQRDRRRSTRYKQTFLQPRTTEEGKSLESSAQLPLASATVITAGKHGVTLLMNEKNELRNFEKICNFDQFCPGNNLDEVLKQYLQYQKSLKSKKKSYIKSFYTFNQSAARRQSQGRKTQKLTELSMGNRKLISIESGMERLLR